MEQKRNSQTDLLNCNDFLASTKLSLHPFPIPQNASENTCEADLHYAELQNLPAFGRGQCDGGANLDAQNSDYATVAVLKEDPSEEDFGSHQQIEDSGVEDGVRDDQIFVEAESASCDLE
ncbi:hypothetical protein Chor_011569 [Crotalus horridus]